MSDDLERMLRRSLDQADRFKKQMILFFLFLIAVQCAGMGWLVHLSGVGDMKAMLILAVVIILAGQVTEAALTWAVVAGMTRTILKMIDLQSKE